MSGIGLAGAFVVAKIFGVAGHDVSWPVWFLPRVFWDDVSVGLAFSMAQRAIGASRLCRVVLGVVYWTAVAWVAINVPVVRALSSPLTVRMLDAAGGPLLDSALHYVTPLNVGAIAAVVMTASWLPVAAARLSRRVRRRIVVMAIGLVCPGPFLGARVDANGLDRNAISTLVRTALPRVAMMAADGDWRRSPMSSPAGTDLSVLAGTARGRNVLLVVLESTASRYLRTYGAADDPTPNVTALTSNALRFQHAYAAYPESIKGLFALLCARFPAFDVSPQRHASARCAPVASTLGAAGYRTALFHSGRFAYLGMDAVVAAQGFDTFEDAGAIGGQVQSSFGVDEPSTVRRMLAWVDELPPSQPFFLTYLPAAGHHPYATVTPGPFRGAGDVIAYKNALHEGDAAIGQLIEGLRRRGRYDNTVVVFIGDHGEAFGQHTGNFGHSSFIYDENIRVPLVIVAPGIVTGRRVIDDVASVVDVVPTIIDLLDVRAPGRGGDGRSLLKGTPGMALFFTDYSVGLLGLQDGCWKFIDDIESSRAQLFDTCRDPDERLDRAAGESERVQRYRERLSTWSSATRDAIASGR